tara:strand:- start:1895 stop:2080 length:186 start_codon:yes stop_codon:yes gene_type:complete
MKHWLNEGKEILKKDKKQRQYRSNQGRSPQDMESMYKGCFWIMIVFITFVSVFAIYNIIIE